MANDKDWLPGAPATRVAGKNIYSVQVAALVGKVRVRVPVGRPVEFFREDLLKLAQEV
jgi:hypothetical protein